MVKYKHEEHMHNLESPNEIVPEIIKLLEPKSVVDVGCGVGTFLKAFKHHGVNDVYGVDGEWVDRDLLHKYISEDEFNACNLEEKIVLKKKYDLAISLEVAEHLSEKSAKIFVESLVSAGKVILFSAAIPLQGGQNHINEQYLSYWESLFKEHNYVLHDVIRPILWDNPKVFCWYKQNTVLFGPKEIDFKTEVQYCPIRNVVHPELFTIKAKLADQMTNPSIVGGVKVLTRSVIGPNNIKKLRQKD